MSTINAITSWRLRTPFYYGWLVLGIGALGAFAATGVAQIVLGGIQGLIFEEMGWDRSTIAYAVTAGTLASGFLTPFIGRLVDRHGPRGLMPAGVVIVGVCLFAIAGIRAVWHFYAAYIVARAIANPTLIGVVPRTAAVNFFHRRRNLALGFTAMARPVGGSINIQFISLLAQAYSWRLAYRALGVFALALAVPLFLFMRKRPEDIGLRPDGDRIAPSDAKAGRRDAPLDPPSTEEPTEVAWTVREAFLTSTFRLILTADALVILSAGALSFQAVLYLKDAGLTQTVAAGALSISSLLGALANPGVGYLADRFSPRSLAIVGLPVVAAVTSLFLMADSGRIGFVVFIAWGAASGGLHILSNMMLAHYFGRASFGSITGLMGPIQLGFLGLGPSFGAVLFNLTGGYTALFSYAIVAYLLATTLIYSTRPPQRPSAVGVRARRAGGSVT